jgi:hypothetical protein
MGRLLTLLSSSALGGLVTTQLDFVTATPQGFTYSGSSVHSYRDVNGVWRQAPSGTARNGSYAHYPDDSGEGYFWHEPAVINKMTSRNANPTNTDGWTKSGDAAATLNDVSDPGTLLADAGLDVLCSSGKLLYLDNTSGVAAAYMDSDATFGNTSNHVVSAWVSGNGTLTRTGGGTPETKAFNEAGLVRKSLQVSPNSSGDKFRIEVAAGEAVYVILEQIEQSNLIDADGEGVPTTPVITNAATGFRAADRMTSTDSDFLALFNEDEGGVVTEYYPTAYGGASIQYLWSLANGADVTGGSANYHTVRLNNDNGYFRATPVSAGTAATQVSTDKPRLNFRGHFAYSWHDTGYRSATPVNSMQQEPSGWNQPTGPFDRFELGALHTGSSGFSGGFKSLTIYSAERTSRQLIAASVTSADVGGFYLGQSNGYGHFRSTPDQDNTGQRAIIQVLDQYRVEVDRNFISNGCTNGSALLEENDGGSGYWIDDGGVEGQVDGYGEAYIHAENMVRGWIDGGGSIPFYIWKQGDGGIGATDPDRHKAGLIHIAEQFIAMAGGNVPFILEPLSRRGDTSNTQMIREIYDELDADDNYPLIVKGPETADAALDADGVHHTEDGYALIGPRSSRYALSLTGYNVSGGVLGGKIVSVARNESDEVRVGIKHEEGTDIAPSSGIQGTYFTDDGVEIAFNTNARDNANVFTGALASSPSGEELFYNFLSGMDDIDNSEAAADLLNDNAANNLLIRSGKFALPYVDSNEFVPLSHLMGGVVFEIDATVEDSYAGSGSEIANLIDSPADGSAKADYDFDLTGLTFNGSAGDAAAYLQTAGSGYMTIGAGNTQFLKDLHKSTGGQDHTLIFVGRAIASVGSQSQTFFGTGGGDSVQHGLAYWPGLWFNQANKFALTRYNGGSASTTTNGGVTLADATDKIMAFSYNPTTRAYKIYGNSATPVTGTAAAFTDTTDATRTFQIMAAGNNAFPMFSGGRFKTAALIDRTITNKEFEAIAALYNARHSVSYF